MEKTKWEDVHIKEINKAFADAKKRKLKHFWLVPCRYADGEATVSVCQEMPYSNPDRREYEFRGDFYRKY